MVSSSVVGEFFSRLIAANMLALVFSAQANSGEPEPARPWSLENIVSAPEVTDIKLSQDRRHALYAVRFGDVERNEEKFELRLLTLSNGLQKVLVNASSIAQLRNIPASNDWSVLANLGDGLQLYRINRGGEITPIIINPDSVLVGEADEAVISWSYQAPQRVGILAHEWSPDGRWLWYSKMRKQKVEYKTKVDADVIIRRDQMRDRVTAMVDFHLKERSGADRLVTSRPSNDRSAFAFGGRVTWQADRVKYRVEEFDLAGRSHFRTYAWNFQDGSIRPDDEPSDDHRLWTVQGLRGGTFSSEGYGSRTALVEKLTSGKKHQYGEVDFVVGDPRSAGSWLSRNGKRAIVGSRNLAQPRYGLAVIDRARVRSLSIRGSVTKCDFDKDLSFGICVREALNEAPELIYVQPESGDYATIAPVSQVHSRLQKLNVSARSWTNRLGYAATGFVVLPSSYDPSRSYPAIFVTHGSDADERFAHQDLQWNYPVQVLAQADYVVVLMNDPAPRQEPRIAAAYRQWEKGEGYIPPEEMQQLLWINGVFSLEDAALEMAKEGLVDIDRLGIAGYSRGSQMVNVTMTQSKLFKAASSGDGASLEPWSYPAAKRSYNNIFGGSPLGPALKNYQSLSPSLRASQACGAILLQMAAPYRQAIDFYSALREASVPAQITLYPGESPSSDETHIFHIPKNRVAAMQENLDWFDFWLKGRAAAHHTHPDRLKNWQKMASELPLACRAGIVPAK